MVHPPRLASTVFSPVKPGTYQACAAVACTVSTRAILGKSQQDLKTFLRLLLPRRLSFCPMESYVVPFHTCESTGWSHRRGKACPTYRRRRATWRPISFVSVGRNLGGRLAQRSIARRRPPCPPNTTARY